MTLTIRQHQILALIAAELTTAQIADKLGLSVPTSKPIGGIYFVKQGCVR